jgi:hypothetical protein
MAYSQTIHNNQKSMRHIHLAALFALNHADSTLRIHLAHAFNFEVGDVCIVLWLESLHISDHRDFQPSFVIILLRLSLGIFAFSGPGLPAVVFAFSGPGLPAVVFAFSDPWLPTVPAALL